MLVGASSPSANHFQALEDLLENYYDSDSCSSSPRYHSFVPESPLGDVWLLGLSPHKQVMDLIVYACRKNFRKENVTFEEGNDSLRS